MNEMLLSIITTVPKFVQSHNVTLQHFQARMKCIFDAFKELNVDQQNERETQIETENSKSTIITV